MRKYLLLVLLTILYIGVKAQKVKVDSIPKIDGEYCYQMAILVDTSLKKDDLYKRSKLFFTDNFKSAKDVIQYDDRSEGKIIGKGNMQIIAEKKMFLTSIFLTWTVSFSTEIICKDGKYRYRIYGIEINQITENSANRAAASNATFSLNDNAYKMTTKGMFKDQFVTLINTTNSKFEAIIKTLNQYMSKKPSNNKDDF